MTQFPPHLRRRLARGNFSLDTHAIVEKYGVHTVCNESKCPNRMECYANKTTTFLALGKECTRSCRFCAIAYNKAPAPPDPHEPMHIANAARDLGLKHIVITMVTRDDLMDGGAAHIAAIIDAVRIHCSTTTVEVLTSDFSGKEESLDIVLSKTPDIFNHNLETVRRLTPKIRHKAEYDRSLSVLRYAKDTHPTLFIKSGFMLGLEESDDEVRETIRDLAEAKVDIVTIGQYLRPTEKNIAVKAFIPLEKFEEYAHFGKTLGIRQMMCGPFVRSDYNAQMVSENCL